MTRKLAPDESQQVVFAQAQVQRARDGDYLSGLEIVIQSAIALRGLLRQNDPPDPFRRVYLEGLLASLERLEAGEDPATALNLQKPAHRISDPNIGVRNVLVFVMVSEELDRIRAPGATPTTAPVRTAIQTVAEKARLDVATVLSAWTQYGSAAGWDRHKSDWK